MDVTSGYVSGPIAGEVGSQVHHNQAQKPAAKMRSLIKDYSFCLFVLFFVVFHKLLFFNIKPIHCFQMFQSHHLRAGLDGVLTSTFTTGMTWTFFPEAHPALTCPVK